MKAAPFSYVRPSTLDDVIDELERADRGAGGKVLAGGQSLVPVLAMRLGRPATLVDITAVDELRNSRMIDDQLVLGAAVRQRTAEREHSRTVPLLGKTFPWIGHREIRSRGTVCGSLAHADPSAELPAVASCLDATIEVAGPDGRRRIPAGEFFTGAMSTVLQPTELIVAVHLPLPQPGSGFGFAEVARRHGDFALAGVAVRVRTQQHKVTEAIVASFGVADRPQRTDVTDQLDQAVQRAGGDEKRLIAELGDTVNELAEEVVTTGGDNAGSPAYRRRLIRALAARELARAHRAGSNHDNRTEKAR